MVKILSLFVAFQIILYLGNILDIFTEQLQFGRDPKTCQYVVGQNDGIDMKFLNKISKIHFVIFKGEEADDTPLLIKDLSRNGTYINGVLIGANQTRIIKTGDVIAVVEPSLKSKNLIRFCVRQVSSLVSLQFLISEITWSARPETYQTK